MARFSPPSPTASSSPSFSYFILISSLLYGANIKSTALLLRLLLLLFSLPVDLSPGFGYLAGAAMLFRLQIGPGGLKEEEEEEQQLPKNVINSVLGRREA